MKNSVSITQFFKGIEEVFNPDVAYVGSYAFNCEVLSLVSKVSNGKNLIDEYFEKNYYSQIRNILKSISFTGHNNLVLMSDTAGNNYGRELKPLIYMFCQEIYYNLVGEKIVLPHDPIEMKGQIVESLREYRRNLHYLKEGKLERVDEEFIAKIKSEYLRNEEGRKKFLGDRYRTLTYSKYLEIKSDYISSFLVGLRFLIPLFDKAIDLKELENRLDLDKFYLAMCKQLIEIAKLSLSLTGKIHNSFVFVEKYIMVIKEARSLGNYNLNINTILLDGTKLKYSVDDALREYNKIKFEHPEFTVHTVEADGRDFRNLENVNELTTQLEELVESKKLEASWDFIKNGNKGKQSEHDIEVIERLKKKDKQTKTREEKIQDINDRMKFLNQSNYEYKINGKNNFEGYIGYIYNNGTVIFEKFYKKQNNYEPANTNATYVMTFKNFVEMSKLSKVEIIEYIKKGGTDVKRIYHTSTWCDRINNIINDKTYDIEAMNKIDRLINEGKISKKNNNR